MKLVIHPQAAADIREQAQYYQSIQPALGVAFLDEIDAAVETVLSMPQAFPILRDTIRMFVLARFPFSILYRVADNTLEVLVVRHHGRHEDFGMDRA